MDGKKVFKGVFISILILFFIPVLLGAQTSPETYLGFKIGADRKLADYNQIKAYFEKLDQESEKLKVFNIGTTTLNRPMIMAVITSEDNLANLDTYREIVKKLKDPRTLTPTEARDLSKKGKVFLIITCNVHASEIGSSQMAMELAYKLVTGDAPFDVDKILSDVIVLLIPTMNPDGQQMVTDWYKRNLGTEYEGGGMPWLYHHYAGHDNARDSFMLNLAETKVYAKVMYHDWLPQIHQDQHQMGSTGARLFIPPYSDPPYPTIHHQVIRSMALCGSSMAYDLAKNGYKGVVHGRNFPAWLIGNLSDTAWLHCIPSLLSEMASVNMATPIFIDPSEIPSGYKEKRMNFPDPWPGGWWRLRDIVDYELTLAQSLIKTCYLHKEDFLYNFYKMYKDCVEIREKNEPFAFVIPKKQHDYLTALRMIETLLLGGVEIHQAEEDFVADGKFYSAGSFVVNMSQPYKPYAQALLEIQKYPDMRLYPGGPPVPPYDNAGTTLPLQMGITCDPIEEPFKTRLTKIGEVPYPSVESALTSSPYVVLDSRMNASYSVVISLLNENVEIYRSVDSVNGKGYEAAPGSFIITNASHVKEVLPPLLEKWHLSFYVLEDIKNIHKAPLKQKRIGLYQSWAANMPEGWVRFFLDDLKIPFVTLKNKDFKGEKSKKVRLKENFDVIVFADESPGIIINGRPGPSSRGGRSYTPPPPEYRGGIGKEGIEALKEFVEEGGILVTLNNACQLAFDEFQVPAGNALEGVPRSKFFCPTSILRVIVDNHTPIGYGMPEKAAAVFSRSPVMNTRIPSSGWDRKIVSWFPDDEILLSGWLLGEDVIASKAAVVDTTYGAGHIILIGIRSQNRAQSHGTYKFLLNSFLYPEKNNQ